MKNQRLDDVIVAHTYYILHGLKNWANDVGILSIDAFHNHCLPYIVYSPNTFSNNQINKSSTKRPTLKKDGLY